MSQAQPACRICLTADGDLESLHQFFEGPTSLLEEIYNCTGIRLVLAPELPGQICVFCKMDVMALSQFRKRCLQTDTFLRKALPEAFREEELSSALALVSCHDVTAGAAAAAGDGDNKDESSIIPCQQQQQLQSLRDEPSVTIAGWSSQESLEFGHDTFVEEVLGNDFRVEEISTTVTRQSTPLMLLVEDPCEGPSKGRKFGRKKSFIHTPSSLELGDDDVLEIRTRIKIKRKGGVYDSEETSAKRRAVLCSDENQEERLVKNTGKKK